MNNEIIFSGKLTFEEYLECHKTLAAKRRLWLRAIAFVSGMLLLMYAILYASETPEFFFGSGMALVIYALAISPVQFRLRVKRNWSNHPRMHKRLEITVSEHGVTTLDDKGNPAHTNWDSFIEFRETKSLLLLYLSPLLSVCLPKRLLPETDLDRFRTLLNSALKSKSPTQ